MPEASVQDLIRQEASKLGVPPELALAVAEQESGFNPTAINPKAVGDAGEHAIGTFQFLPSTAKTLGIDPNDPRQNIQGGVQYLKQLLDKHEGDLSGVLSEYGGVRTDTQYVPGVLGRMPKFVVKPQPTTPATPPKKSMGATGSWDAPVEEGFLTRTAKGAVAAFDPRTSAGRVNLAGGAAAIGATMLVPEVAVPVAVARGVAILPWVARVLGPPTAAAIAGYGETKAEQAVGTVPQSESAVKAGGIQAAQELGGRTAGWALRRVAKPIAASAIGKAALKSLGAEAEAVRVAGRDAIDAASAKATQLTDRATASATAALDKIKSVTADSVAAAKAFAGRTTAGAKQAATDALVKSELDAAAKVAESKLPYEKLIAAPPNPVDAAAATRAVVSGSAPLTGEAGAATRALNAAGKRIEEAAQQGPPVETAPIKEALAAMGAKARPGSVFGVKEAPSGIGFLQNAVGSQGVAASLRQDPNMLKILAQHLGVSETHPLPGILGKIEALPETISFADAHALKEELYGAINFDRTARKPLERITKGISSVLRGELGKFAPYNEATAAYAAVVPLYRTGVGRSLIRAAATNPDAVSRVLDVKSPAAAQAVKDLVVAQAAKGGDAALGQQAWDAIRANFTYNKLVSGGIEGLSERVRTYATQFPDFAKVVHGDQMGQEVLSNLDKIGQAYTQAVALESAAKSAAKSGAKTAVADATARGAAGVEEASAIRDAAVLAQQRRGQADVQTVARQGQAAVHAAKRDLAAARGVVLDKGQQFRESSLAKFGSRDIESSVVDVAKALKLGVGSTWGGIATARLILRGAKEPELLYWMSLSPQRTQQMTRLLLSRKVDRAGAAFLREALSAVTPQPEAQKE